MKNNRLRNKRQSHKIKRNRYTVLPIICLTAFSCAGCGFDTLSGLNSEGASRGISMESTPIVDYTVPQLFPNIMIDITGYRAEGLKRAAVQGKRLPDEFDLVDARTGKVVFTGMLENVEYHQEQDLYSAYADFDDWVQEGSYYLECEYIGRSYTFSLVQGLYDRLFEEICQDMIDDCREQRVSFADVKRILLAYEWYGEVFPDGDGDGIPDILEAVAGWIEAKGEQEAVAGGQEASYAAILAKFSYLYQNYDRQYATECLKRASVVFDQMQSATQKDAECFHALTELYRATGLGTYNNQIVEYKTYFESHTDHTEEMGYLHGAMTYIGTRQKVDVELCAIFMDALMEQGEIISGLYPEMIHPVKAHNNGAPDLLRHASELSCANFVMNNYQYNYVMEEVLHYLRGRNPQSIDFYSAQPENKSQYLILLAQLVAVQENL